MAHDLPFSDDEMNEISALVDSAMYSSETNFLLTAVMCEYFSENV